MYKLGKHFNKHGHKMGYKSKREYEKGARKFIENIRRKEKYMKEDGILVEGTRNKKIK